MATPDDPRAWLEAHVNLESVGVPVGTTRRATRPTRSRIESLVALLGSPQLEYPVVHLTGTNGKTSVARLATALLVEGGLSIGSFTSPHLERVNERIAWNGHDIDDATFDELLTLIATIEPHLPEVPSFFEILTGAAYRWFADVAVDAAVVEVGLGGRWDATNVVHGQVAVVTNVSVDHVEFLGRTRLEIAAEKAGIVEPGATLVLGETDDAVQAPFLERGAARVLVRDRDFAVTKNRVAHGGRLISLETPEARYEDVFLSLHGAHQADNAAVAVAAAEALLDRALPADLVAAVLGQARAPGRLEVVGHSPLVLLDGAHNVAGAHALREALAEEFPAAARTLVVGLLREKDPPEMLDALGAPEADRLIACEPPSPRARPATEVAEAARRLGLPGANVEAVPDVGDALHAAVAATPPDGQVVVTGSLYVVGAARTVARAAGAAGDREPQGSQ
jgi:dihydrofolate synthase/folylpolyglutamate synthase